MFKFGSEYIKDDTYIPEKIGEPYILEAYIPKKFRLEAKGCMLQLSCRNELRHAVGGVAAHTLRYFSENKEEFNVFRARGQAIWWLRNIYNSFKWWRAYSVNAEGERKDMPMLYVGESFGAVTSYEGKEADIVLSAFENAWGIIDPEDTGGTVFAVGYSERGGLFNSPDKYAVKTIIGGKYIGSGVSVAFPAKKNLRLMAEHTLKRKDLPLSESNMSEEIKKMKVVILSRKRHESLIEEVKSIGAQVILVHEDDLSPAFAIARGDVDFITGVGGVPEGVLSAMLVEKLGGEMTLRLIPNNVAVNEKLLSKIKNWDLFTMEEIEILKNFHIVKPGTEKNDEIPFNRIFTSKDLARGKEMVFTASIIKETPWIKYENGNRVPGVKIDPETSELTVHTIRIAENDVEIVPIIYKTAINKLKNELRNNNLNLEEHINAHIQLAKVYAEFGLFEMADESLGKAMHDRGVNEDQRRRYKMILEYVKGLECLTNEGKNVSIMAIKHFENANKLDDDGKSEGLRSKRMIKRIYEYIGDKYNRDGNYKSAIIKYKEALKYGPHELKLYRKINTLSMSSYLSKYFEQVNKEYYKHNCKSDKKLNIYKLNIALNVYSAEMANSILEIDGDPWLIFFRRTVLHNMGLSYKLEVLIKLRVLLNKLNSTNDDELSKILKNEFKVDEKDIGRILDFRKGRAKFHSVSELYQMKTISMDCLAKLLIPNVKVATHNEFESAKIPLSISIREAVERRYKNILQEIKYKYTEEAQEHSYAVAESYHYVGLALYDVGDYSGARIYYGNAIRKFREIIEKFKGITPVNAQYRIGNMFEEMAMLFTDREKNYYSIARNEYRKIVDEETAVKLFTSAYKINTTRIDQATERIKELESVLNHGKPFNSYSIQQPVGC